MTLLHNNSSFWCFSVFSLRLQRDTKHGSVCALQLSIVLAISAYLLDEVQGLEKERTASPLRSVFRSVYSGTEVDV
jgi:hypothetical protein